jgi:Na+-translocating ferredoxin:NAD+ oxidoreductase RnfA subunit
MIYINDLGACKYLTCHLETFFSIRLAHFNVLVLDSACRRFVAFNLLICYHLEFLAHFFFICAHLDWLTDNIT